jgi:hypothetical protein
MDRSGAEPDPAQSDPLLDTILAAFSNRLDIRHPVIRTCLEKSIGFLVPSPVAGELVLERKSLISGIIADGLERITENGDGPSVWLASWLDTNGFPMVARPLAASVRRDFEAGLKPVLSESVRGRVLPKARSYAKATTFDGRISLKHLILSLIDNPLDWDGITSATLRREELAALRDHIVSRILEDLGPNDNLDGWDVLARSTLRTPADSEEPAERPASAQSLPTHGDHPATIDSLGRKVFAKVLAERLRSAQREARDIPDFGAFIAHIHGPWGYGKTSVLNFMRTELTEGAQPWLVVDFNAWKHNRLRPPWWSLIKAIYETARKVPAVEGNWRRWWVWTSWKLRADLLPLAIVGVLAAIGIAGALNTADATLKLVSSLITAGAAVFAATRVVSFGSAKAAEAYAQLKTDPYRPIVELYRKLIQSIGRPVAIFIDDLDRCEASYVVDLIEGIQTLFRAEPVVFVIAADRKWICSAFEKKYADFAGPISEPARPLGYLFLDKLFQISAALPALSRDARDGYWKALLDSGMGGVQAGDAAPITAEDAEAQVKGIGSIEGLQQVIDEAPVGHRPALRAAAAMEITRAEHAEAIEHSLQPFADLLEPNPRAMKRLVNAVGMAQARAFLEARDVPLDTLARWTMIELRWPLLADHLTANMADIAHSGAMAKAIAEAGVEKNVAEMLADARLAAIVGAADAPKLDEDRLRVLLG